MNSRSGLSLFELLVALALLALIATGLAGTMGLAVNMWDRSTSLSASAEEIALRSRLRIWLRNAVPPSRLMPFPTNFEGSEDGFSFVTLSETPFAPDAAALRVTVKLAESSITMTTQIISETGEGKTFFEGFLSHSISPTFSYYASTSDPTGWRNNWGDPLEQPNLLRIQVLENEVHSWPDFIVDFGPSL